MPGRNAGQGKRREERVVKARNASAARRKGSGALAHAKGDVIDPVALLECKDGYTRLLAKGSSSFSVRREWLMKISREALREGRLPGLVFHFKDAPDQEQWAILDASILFDLLEQAASATRIP